MADTKVADLPAAAALDGSELYYGVQGGADTKVTGAQLSTLVGGRTRLVANADYYVDNDTGSDSNDGSIGLPWQTLQYATDYVANYIDIGGKTVSVHVADSVSTYVGVAFKSFVGGGNLVFLGNNTTLGNVKIGNGSQVGSFYSGGVGNTLIWISGFEFIPTNGACIDFDGADRGICLLGEPTFLLSSKNKFSGCQANGYVLIGNIFDSALDVSVVDGNALNALTPKAFYLSLQQNPQAAFLYGPDFSITGTVAFTRAFAVVVNGAASINGSFGVTGTVTGLRFEVGAAGSLFIDTLTALPGSLPGTNYGGQLALGFPNQCYIGPIPTTKSLQSPTTGFSITVSDNVGALILTPAGTLATGTITLPANPIDQQRLVILSTKQITALTVSPNAGQSVVGNPATLAANAAINAIYNYATTTWYLSVSGIAIGSPIGGATSGSVLFVGAGVLAQDNAKFTWDDTNYILSLGDAGTNAALYLNAVPALYEVPSASGNNWFEGNAGNTTLSGSGNFGTGDLVLSSLTTGSGNLAIGGIDSSSPYNRSTAENITTGGAGDVGNVAMGASALCTVSTGAGNVGVGSRTLESTSLDSYNVAIGPNVLGKLGVGGAGSGNNDSNVAIGNAALSNFETGANLIGMGSTAGSALVSSSNGGDIFIGGGAGASISSTSGFNTMIGSGAGFSITGGSGNTILGRWLGTAASYTDVIALASGNNNLWLDYAVTNAGKWTFAAPPVVPAYTVAALPAGVTGAQATVTDGDAGLAWGATVINSGAGATKYLVWYNGANWTVAGK